jgi:hypothetical protein
MKLQLNDTFFAAFKSSCAMLLPNTPHQTVGDSLPYDTTLLASQSPPPTHK